MQFCRWYPLAEAAAYAPVGEGVLQLRLVSGLVDYPTGKSAMVHYEHARDARAAAVALAGRFAGKALLCRHLEIEPGSAVDIAAFHAKVRDEFIRRFGTAPALPP